MAYGRGLQIEKNLDYELNSKRGLVQHSHSYDKKIKSRRERRRAKHNPECVPEYKRYYEYEW